MPFMLSRLTEKWNQVCLRGQYNKQLIHLFPFPRIESLKNTKNKMKENQLK